MAARTLILVLGLTLVVLIGEARTQNATSERHRRLIPYMNFYTAQSQPISYSFTGHKQPQREDYLANKLAPVRTPVKQTTNFLPNKPLYPTNQALYPINQVKYSTNQVPYRGNPVLYPASQHQVTQFEVSEALDYLLNQLQKFKSPAPNQVQAYPTHIPQDTRKLIQYPIVPKKPVHVSVDYPYNYNKAANQVPEYPDNQVVEYSIIKSQELGNNAVKSGIPAQDDDYYYYDDEDDLDDVDDVESSTAKPGPARVTSSSEGGTPGRPGVDYPILYKIPTTDFNCKTQRYKGFFGDPATRCQVWHYCDLNGGQASFLCPNGTIFSQVGLTCDWWFNVRCASTVQLYVLNERLYKYILPATPSFPEDYSGPLVDRYLTLKFQEKMKQKTNKT